MLSYSAAQYGQLQDFRSSLCVCLFACSDNKVGCFARDETSLVMFSIFLIFDQRFSGSSIVDALIQCALDNGDPGNALPALLN